MIISGIALALALANQLGSPTMKSLTAVSKAVLGASAIFFALAPIPAHAIPELQLYAEGATYDSATETWVVNASSGTVRLWTIGDVDAKGTISSVKLSVAYASAP